MQRGHLHRQRVAAVPVHATRPQDVLKDIIQLHIDKPSRCRQLLQPTEVTALISMTLARAGCIVNGT